MTNSTEQASPIAWPYKIVQHPRWEAEQALNEAEADGYDLASISFVGLASDLAVIVLRDSLSRYQREARAEGSS